MTIETDTGLYDFSGGIENLNNDWLTFVEREDIELTEEIWLPFVFLKILIINVESILCTLTWVPGPHLGHQACAECTFTAAPYHQTVFAFLFLNVKTLS